MFGEEPVLWDDFNDQTVSEEAPVERSQQQQQQQHVDSSSTAMADTSMHAMLDITMAVADEDVPVLAHIGDGHAGPDDAPDAERHDVQLPCHMTAHATSQPADEAAHAMVVEPADLPTRPAPSTRQSMHAPNSSSNSSSGKSSRPLHVGQSDRERRYNKMLNNRFTIRLSSTQSSKPKDDAASTVSSSSREVSLLMDELDGATMTMEPDDGQGNCRAQPLGKITFFNERAMAPHARRSCPSNETWRPSDRRMASRSNSPPVHHRPASSSSSSSSLYALPCSPAHHHRSSSSYCAGDAHDHYRDQPPHACRHARSSHHKYHPYDREYAAYMDKRPHPSPPSIMSRETASIFDEAEYYAKYRRALPSIRPSPPMFDVRPYGQKRPCLQKNAYMHDSKASPQCHDSRDAYGDEALYASCHGNPTFVVKGLEHGNDRRPPSNRPPIRRCRSNDSWVLELDYGQPKWGQSIAAGEVASDADEHAAAAAASPMSAHRDDFMWPAQSPEDGWTATSHIDAWQTCEDSSKADATDEKSMWLTEVTVRKPGKSRKAATKHRRSLDLSSMTGQPSANAFSAVVNINAPRAYRHPYHDDDDDDDGGGYEGRHGHGHYHHHSSVDPYTRANPDGSVTIQMNEHDLARENFDALFC
ncbi:hypothetical protein SYNPS1DRAFT_27287 [Syncephalis pseudoplumigaleata]|uniref:Uncharacterized protein n=1 Tax=Syncephalis pseudoplumigaleata TaxID=1712513 RepID=A0A4P9Z3B7_9FUNG|nr:hypothetical protein SYNPS1DRAFT_27287 [Syncephalis pseudoplumigaleata]|eukprot:RKP27047.1 hypothetical protein SYNPS1DRAFT_27287 [Syncephalis pseudoplumigaleata]